MAELYNISLSSWNAVSVSTHRPENTCRRHLLVLVESAVDAGTCPWGLQFVRRLEDALVCAWVI